MKHPPSALARLRKIALALPRASETLTFGNPTFQAGKKTFAVFENYKGADMICFKATLEDQALLTMDPRFIVAPYSGKHGWTSMHVAGGIDRKELSELVVSSYRLVASKAMISELDERRRPKKAK